MAGATELERLVVRLVGDGTDYAKTINTAVKQTTTGAKQITQATNKVTATQAQGAAQVASLTKNTKKLTFAEKNLAAGLVATELRFNSAGRQIDQYGVFITRTEKKVSRLTRSLGMMTGMAAAAGTKMQAAGRRMTFGLTLPIIGIAAASVKAGSDIQGAFAGLRKTVDAPQKVLDNIKKQMEGMITEKGVPFDLVELLGIGETAGQLGIDVNDIVDFTGIIADLKVTTNLGESAAGTMARIANITGLPASDFRSLGSAIVALGNDSASSEAEIANMTLRLAGAGRSIGLTVPQITGLSAALASVGIQAEAGGTAFSKLFLDMSKQVATGGEDLVAFADTADMSVDKFSALFRKDAMGAITAVLGGLNKMGKAEGILALEAMGIEGTRLTDALQRTSGAIDLVLKTQKTSNEAFEAGTALAAEAAIRYAGFKGQVKNLWAQIKLLGGEIFKILEPALRSTITLIKGGLKWFRSLSNGMKQTVVVIGMIVAAAGPLILVVGLLLTAIAPIVIAIKAITIAGIILTAKILLIVGVVAALTAGFAWLMVELFGVNDIMKTFSGLWAGLKEKAAKFFNFVIGFVANFRQNMGIMIKWLRGNWLSVFKDMGRIAITVGKNMLLNTQVVVRTLVRIWTLWQGWMAQMFSNVFTVDFPNLIAKGIVLAARLYVDFANTAWEALQSIFTGQDVTMDDFTGQLGKDFEKGLGTGNILAATGDIIKEELRHVKGPLDGFKSSIKEGPQLALEWGTKTAKALDDGLKSGDGGDPAAGVKGAGKAIVNMSAEASAALDKLHKSVTDFNGSMQQQITTFSMTTRAAKIHALETKRAALAVSGASAEQLVALAEMDAQMARMKGFDQHLTRLEKQKKLTAEAAATQKAFMSAGAALNKQYRKPAQVFADRQKELNKMLNGGAITAGTFTSAMADAHKQLNKEYKVELKVGGVEAVEAGTAAAMARVNEFASLRPKVGGAGVMKPAAAAVAAKGIAGGAGAAAGTVTAKQTATATGGTGSHEAKVEELLTRIAVSMEEASLVTLEPVGL